LAKSVVDDATGQAEPEPEPANDGKNPAAVALGRLGGLKGGKAREEVDQKAAVGNCPESSSDEVG